MPFEDFMAEAVLRPAGMAASTYAQPLPEDRWADAASGHGPDGRPVAGGWHVYPEQGVGRLVAALATEVERDIVEDVAQGLRADVLARKLEEEA